MTKKFKNKKSTDWTEFDMWQVRNIVECKTIGTYTVCNQSFQTGTVYFLIK